MHVGSKAVFQGGVRLCCCPAGAFDVQVAGRVLEGPQCLRLQPAACGKSVMTTLLPVAACPTP